MGPLLLIAAGGFMANISWLKWPDLVIAFGEQRVLKNLQATPPTYIAIVYHDFLEFGTCFFGEGFRKRYLPVDFEGLRLIQTDREGPHEGGRLWNSFV